MTLTIEQLKELLPDAKLDYRKQNMRAICPKCKHDEFGISLKDNHQFGCFRKKKCGFAGNIFTLLEFLGKPISSVARPFLVLDQFKTRNLLKVENEALDLTLEKVRPPLGFKRLESHPYLDSRGFVEYDKYEVGQTTIDPRYGKNYIIFLIRQEGEIRGYLGRHIWSKEKIEQFNEKKKQEGSPKRIMRYKNSITDFAKLLWGIDEVTDNTHTIILVEGGFDKFNVDRLLQLDDQEGIKCCASFKCKLTPEQIELMRRKKGVQRIIQLYDPDVVDEIKKNAFKLEEDFEVLIGFGTTGHDPGEMDIEELMSILEDLESPASFANGRITVRRLDF